MGQFRFVAPRKSQYTFQIRGTALCLHIMVNFGSAVKQILENFCKGFHSDLKTYIVPTHTSEEDNLKVAICKHPVCCPFYLWTDVHWCLLRWFCSKWLTDVVASNISQSFATIWSLGENIMVIYDTEYPYWDHVPFNNTKLVYNLKELSKSKCKQKHMEIMRGDLSGWPLWPNFMHSDWLKFWRAVWQSTEEMLCFGHEERNHLWSFLAAT